MTVTTNNDLISSALERMVTKLESSSKQTFITPSEWMERYYWVPRPFNLETGEPLPPGPIRLSDLQKKIVDEALSRDANGLFKYATIIYSTIKKSGKSAIAGGVSLYMSQFAPFGRVYLLANDANQSDNRLFYPVKDCVKFHKKNGLLLQNTKIVEHRAKAYFENESIIEAIACDAAGEAGSEPTAVIISEAWAYDTDKKKQLFTELTIPPTMYGRAIRWVESYAGYQGQSDILWNLYQTGVLNGVPHPDFLDVVSEEGPVVRVNETARMFCYWDHEPRMIWQNEAYYREEALILIPAEFERIHKNRWISPTGVFVAPEWWDACADETLPILEDSKTPVVVAVDASETNDCTAIVAVTRDPTKPETDVAIRACKIFRPVPGKSAIILEETAGKTIQEWGKKWNIVCIAYDDYQMAKLVQDYRRGQVTIDPKELVGLNEEQVQEYLKATQRAIQRWYYKFSQQSLRAVSDKRLYDMILNQQIHWNPTDLDNDVAPRGNDETLTKHIKQAGASKDQNKYRLKKLSNDLKIDGAVALSMAVERCLTLILDNVESRDNIEVGVAPLGSTELETRRLQLLHREQMLARKLGRG